MRVYNILVLILPLVVWVGFFDCSSSGPNMATWFKNIIGFDINTPGVWGHDALIWDYTKLWKDKKELKDYMVKFWASKSAGEIKGKTNPITWFTKDSDDFLNMVGNGYFYKYEPDEIDTVIKNLNDQFIAARDNYYNKNGKVPVAQKQVKDKENRNVAVVDITFPFGPWLYWTKPAWDEIDYKYKSAKRKGKLNEALRRVQKTSDSSTLEVATVSAEQRKRGRPEKSKKKKQRGRSRDRTSRTSSKRDDDDYKSGVDSQDESV